MAIRKMRRDEPLSVEIKRGKLVIEIGVATLGKCAEQAEELCHWDEEDTWQHPTVTNALAFADSVVEALTEEDEIGGTILHAVLEKGMSHAVDWGCAGITVPERKRYAKS